MIHKYFLNGVYIVLDVNSGSVHTVDKLCYEILDYYKSKNIDEIYALLPEYEASDIEEAYGEIKKLEECGLLYSPDADRGAAELAVGRGAVIKALCLHMAHSCNLCCTYCFAGDGEYHSTSREKLMRFETGKKAIDFLIENSGARRNLEVDFFGGEPLLNFETVKKIVEYARGIEKEHGKNFRFTITTNGLLLDAEKLEFINRHMQNIVLSIDGRKNVNDRNRKKPCGGGTYDDIIGIFQKTAESRAQKDYYVRGTFTAENLDFAEDVLHLASLGFRQVSAEPVVGPEEASYTLKNEHLPVLLKEYERLAEEMLALESRGEGFNFFHFNIDLSGGPCLAKRVTGCGAGTEYLAVSPDGDIYPCHQFTGADGFLMGSVFNGLSPNELTGSLAEVNVCTKSACSSCFAKYYCSGGCTANAYFANGDFNEPYRLGCELQKKRIECAIMIKACGSGA